MINREYIKWELFCQKFQPYILKDIPKRAVFLINLLKQYNIKPEYVAEVGVWRGHSSVGFLRFLPSIKVFHAVDPWLKYPDYSNSNDKKADGDFYLDEQICRDRLYSFRNKVQYHKDFSEEAAKAIPNNSLDFVFLDGNHSYEYVKKDIKIWTKKIRIGGILAGHDVDNVNFPGVRQAVDELLLSNWKKGVDYVWWIKVK